MKDETKYQLGTIFLIIALSGIVLWFITCIVWMVLHTSVIIGSMDGIFHDLVTGFTTHPYRGMYLLGLFIFVVFSILTVLVTSFEY